MNESSSNLRIRSHNGRRRPAIPAQTAFGLSTLAVLRALTVTGAARSVRNPTILAYDPARGGCMCRLNGWLTVLDERDRRLTHGAGTCYRARCPHVYATFGSRSYRRDVRWKAPVAFFHNRSTDSGARTESSISTMSGQCKRMSGGGDVVCGDRIA